MALRYTSVLPNDLLLRDIKAHMDWFEAVLRQSFFSNATAADGGEFTIPTIFAKWCADNTHRDSVDEAAVEQMRQVHDALAETGADCLRAEGGMTQENYTALTQCMDAYIKQLQKFSEDLAGSNFSIDTVTGLRSAAGMKNEIARELDRRDRKSDVFCVCALSIDGHKALAESRGERRMKEVYAHIAELLMDSLRSYDDGYYLGEGEYLLCLKHAELLDACTVMDRICARIATTPAHMSGTDESVSVTISCGVAEPVPGDKIDDIFANAARAMKEAQEEGGNQVMDWKEKSALQQYAEDAAIFD
ncbi:MAG: diguanylate cyclase [Alphaproteobacteria bacterium]|nr:MAG: diguanylate cyclase [Alphaproteobacteria bacterium]